MHGLLVSSMNVFILEQTSLGAMLTSSLMQAVSEMLSAGLTLPSSSGYFQKWRELPERRHHRRHQLP